MQVSVLSPEKPIFKGASDSVLLRTINGDLNVLNNHANLLAELDIGEIEIKQGKETTKIVLNGGMLEVYENKLTILASEAQPSKELIKTEIERAIAMASSRLSQELPKPEIVQIEKQIEYLKFKQLISSRF